MECTLNKRGANPQLQCLPLNEFESIHKCNGQTEICRIDEWHITNEKKI